jgi:ketosteroid isomerase-like protein
LFSVERIIKLKIKIYSSLGDSMIKLLFALSSLLILIAGCSTRDESFDLEQEKQKVRDLDQAMLLAETQRNIEKTMGLIGEGAIFHPPGNPAIVGRDEIRSFYKEWFNIPYKEIVSENAEIWVSESGDLACLIGNSYMGFDNPEGDIRSAGKYTSIRKKVNNKWLCFYVSWSGNE